MRRKIDFIAPPFSGHLHPILAMARTLRYRHEVRVLSSEQAQARIAAAGVAGVSLLGDCDAEMRGIVEPARQVGSNPLRLHAQFRRTLVLMQRFRTELRELYRDERPDLIIADFTVPVAGVVAREYGIPWWTSLPSPSVLETPDGPPCYMGGLAPPSNCFEGLRNAGGRKLIRAFKRLTFAFFRRDIAKAGVHRLYNDNGYESIYSTDRILALGLEELEFPCAWPESLTFIGPQLFTPPSRQPAPEFLEGKRHVLITVGTHLHWVKDRLAAEVERVAGRMPDLEFHFSDGRDTSEIVRRGNFHRHPFVDYDTQVGRYDVVVHHAGTGILYHCLRHGKPAVVYPIDFDQFDYAARLVHAGVALRLRSPSDLEAAIRNAMRSSELPKRCAQIAEQLTSIAAEERLIKLIDAQLG
jgi:UDP:flavonoid glycosyltransferase YjiC (YdhE family)